MTRSMQRVHRGREDRSHSIGLVLDPKAFKAYDVRGVYPDELDEEGAYAIGRAYVEHFEPRSIAVGRDMRLSSPSMSAALIEGAADGGADVLDLGLVGTEMVYYAVGELGLDGGVCVTASHNPKQYTGMKIVRRGALPVGGESGLLDVRDRAVKIVADSNYLPRGAVTCGSRTSGPDSSTRCSRSSTWGDRAAESRHRRGERDGGSDAAAGARPAPDRRRHVLLRAGRDRSRTTSRTRSCPRTASSSSRKTLEEHADLGVAYDGDADRCFFVDDTGDFVPGDFITALLAESILRKEGGGNVIYDVRASRAVPETIERAGGVPLINRVGHAYIKHRMRKDDAVFGGEVSAHYYFRDFVPGRLRRRPLPAPTRVDLRCAARSCPRSSRRTASGSSSPARSTRRSPTSPLKLQELEERYADGRVTHLDGISVDYDDWHFNVRPSNTEPLLRLNLEATSEELMEAKRDEVLDLIRS